MANRETKLQIVVDAQNNTTGAFKSVSGNLDQLAGTLKNIGTVGAIGFAAVAAATYKAVDAAAEAAKVDAQLDAVLTSTAHAAGIMRGELEEQAVALSRLSTFDDEAVKSTQALLLTFTGIKGPIFKDATQAILNVSVALGQDLKSSAIQVGKALNDPVEGINALRRVGVSFSEDQRAVIEQLVATGKTAEAQALIIKELNTEFGGSAQAQAATYAGQIAQLKNRFGDLQETIGAAVIPVLQSLLTQIQPVLESMIAWAEQNPELTKVIIAVALALTALVAVLLPIGIALPGIIIAFQGLAVAFAFLTALSAPMLLALTAVIVTLGFLVSQGYLTKEAWQNVWLGIKLIAADSANAVITTVEAMINFVLEGVNKAIRAINQVIAAAQKVPGIGKFAKSLKELSPVSLGGISTETITANDLAGRSTPVKAANILNMSGNIFLSEDVAELIGDKIMSKLKLSNAL